MIELKVGDKFVVRSTPLGWNENWNKEMDNFCGSKLTIKEVYLSNISNYYIVKENEYKWHPSMNHIDWESTNKLREVKKTYEWNEAIKMALEGKIMQSIETCNFIKEIDGSVCVYATPTFNYEVILHVSKQLLENKFIEYIEPINLTDDEKTILKNVDSKYKWITRDENDTLYLYEEKPLKSNFNWVCSSVSNYRKFDLFNNTFQQIKWENEEPTSIKELLGSI